ncbi:DUF6036 family nucleotidyltransferase [Zhenpiania hominis]|uniref:DUF6036 domain-containing protein n=1 Tax=Zhenpiania hominis TaxID=2763644 RepID=A0A923SRS4_9FIRM|nr:DUF6036 family nucleotidyltransferase [Zhenpiania hominis]MBC6680981.1 hypothetical protein [Zhenpiania hominis]
MSPNSFTKDNLDNYLKELAKEYRRVAGKNMPAEIVLAGGAAILVNYGFRDMTTDIDAIIHAASSMKEAINRVGDRFGLPNKWINNDFMRTGSYSPKLDEISVYYRTFANVVTVRSIKGEYLIAMKLRAGRKYKNDLSDIIGVLAAHEHDGESITLDRINEAVESLYGGWDEFPENSKLFIEDAMKNGKFEEIYSSVKEEEKQSKEILIDFGKEYENVANAENVDDILKTLKAKLKK